MASYRASGSSLPPTHRQFLNTNYMIEINEQMSPRNSKIPILLATSMNTNAVSFDQASRETVQKALQI